jgi:hypothetical protein
MARKKTGSGWCRQSPVPVGGGGRVGLQVTSGRPPWCPSAGAGQWCGGIGCTAGGGSRGIGFSWPVLGLAPRPGRRRQPARWHQARPPTRASRLPQPSFPVFLSKQWMHDGSRARQGGPFMSITLHRNCRSRGSPPSVPHPPLRSASTCGPCAPCTRAGRQPPASANQNQPAIHSASAGCARRRMRPRMNSTEGSSLRAAGRQPQVMTQVCLATAIMHAPRRRWLARGDATVTSISDPAA